MKTEKMLEIINNLAEQGMNAENTLKVFSLLGINGFDEENLSEIRLWSDCLPISDEIPYTEEQRNLHILWECVDRVPWGIHVPFAVPFRQIIAKRLFKKCGDGFVAHEGCRFNYGQNIEVGENVSWNQGSFFDSKGGISFGDFSMATEYCKIFTHSHSESDHNIRSYAPVKIGSHAKLYTNCTILPGITVGTGAIVATGSVVTKNVDDYTLVSGVPAKPMRKRNTEDRNDFNQYMLKNNMFQI